MTTTQKWLGEKPKQCDLCKKALADKPFIDGRTQYGPWAIMDEVCHSAYGYGLGVGSGQKYDGITLEKVAG